MFNNINNVIRTHLRGTALALSCMALLGFALVPKPLRMSRIRRRL
jgi:hypothetical protein